MDGAAELAEGEREAEGDPEAGRRSRRRSGRGAARAAAAGARRPERRRRPSRHRRATPRRTRTPRRRPSRPEPWTPKACAADPRPGTRSRAGRRSRGAATPAAGDEAPRPTGRRRRSARGAARAAGASAASRRRTAPPGPRARPTSRPLEADGRRRRPALVEPAPGAEPGTSRCPSGSRTSTGLAQLRGRPLSCAGSRAHARVLTLGETHVTYAIIKVAGKQYRVREGERLLVDRLAQDEGATFTPDRSARRWRRRRRCSTRRREGHGEGPRRRQGPEDPDRQVQEAHRLPPSHRLSRLADPDRDRVDRCGQAPGGEEAKLRGEARGEGCEPAGREGRGDRPPEGHALRATRT